jgi:hypothetical protein
VVVLDLADVARPRRKRTASSPRRAALTIPADAENIARLEPSLLRGGDISLGSERPSINRPEQPRQEVALNASRLLQKKYENEQREFPMHTKRISRYDMHGICSYPYISSGLPSLS